MLGSDGGAKGEGCEDCESEFYGWLSDGVMMSELVRKLPIALEGLPVGREGCVEQPGGRGWVASELAEGCDG